FWALCAVCVVNMARYFSSLRALLVVLRGCDPLLYQYVDGGGFFTSHGQPSQQMRLVGYFYAQPVSYTHLKLATIWWAVVSCG
ncbi:hypothetical protein QMO23_25825, partial [Klebsiella pneumoniae]|nr:hypothetical protein [Klebsiella pneumoniae]